MKIIKVSISNWRSFKNISIFARDLMVVLGQNNHGKSNLLSAILFFFGEIKHQDLDFNFGSQEMYVEIEFGELDASDQSTFKKYITNKNTIFVRKTAYIGGAFDYNGYIQNPKDEWLREENASSYAKRETAESLPFYKYLPASGRITKQDIIDAQIKYINEHVESVEFKFELESTNFLGLKSVAKGIFGDVYFIPAVKDASDEFTSKETSVFGRLYAEVIATMSQSNSEWKDTKEKVQKLFQSFNDFDDNGMKNNGRPLELVKFEKAITDELATWGAKVNIEISPPDIEGVFKANTQVWVDDGVRTDIRRKGHGLQRALIVALIQVLARKVITNDAKGESGSSTRKQSASKFFIFEEPELYLHPQAQRALFDSLVSLTENGSQVILCTHSSGLIDVEKYQSIYIVHKESDNSGSKIRYCHSDLFIGDAKKDFNLAYWINPDRGELFFAKKVILVEGATDKVVLPHLAKLQKIFRYDYTFIDCGSKDNIPLYVKLLNSFEIPYVAVYDVDHQKGKDHNAIASADKSTKIISDAIDTKLGKSVVLNNDIEEEIGLSSGGKNKPYTAITHVSEVGFNCPQGLQKKLIDIFQ